jgi:hypothetical protein
MQRALASRARASALASRSWSHQQLRFAHKVSARRCLRKLKSADGDDRSSGSASKDASRCSTASTPLRERWRPHSAQRDATC